MTPVGVRWGQYSHYYCCWTQGLGWNGVQLVDLNECDPPHRKEPRGIHLVSVLSDISACETDLAV